LLALNTHIMIVNKITEAVIYESPDGGETVYVREHGSTQRQLHSQSPRARDLVVQLEEDKLWGSIRKAAETNPAIQAALEQVKVIYHLSKS
jgi:hypothetical protein